MYLRFFWILSLRHQQVSIFDAKDFVEVLAVGTAVGIISVSSITRRSTNDVYVYDEDGKAGDLCLKLLKHLQGIQLGRRTDEFGWLVRVKEDALAFCT